jgi:stage V sporulation protein B
VGHIAESGLRISAVVALPMGLGLSVLAAPIVAVIYPDTHQMGPTLLSWLGVASVFVCITLVTNAILQADGNEALPIVSMVVGGVVKIACNLLLVRRPELNIVGAAMGTVACYAVISVLNCFFIYRRLPVKPNYGRAFLRPLGAALAMAAAAWAVYGLASRLLHVTPESGRMLQLLPLAVAIGVAALVYLVMVVLTRSVTLEDMKLMPKGERIARLLHIR